ncbi:MAG: hypothetical protein ACXWW5_00200 [Actinomycetota bacterium]
MNETRELLERVGERFAFPERAFERLERRRDRKRRNQRMTAGAVGVAFFAAAVWIATLGGPFDDTQAPASTGPTVASETPTGDSSAERPPFRRLVNSADGVPFSFSVPTYGWERFGSISINKSETGSQGAEAIIYWSSFPDGDYVDYYGHDARPCANLLSPQVGRSGADLAAAVATAPGTELVTGPSNVTVGGFPAKHVVLVVRRNVGCDPGFFYRWRGVIGGALWTTTPVSATMRVWIVDVDGTRLFIGAATSFEASSGLDEEIEQIVGSIRFD